MQSTPRVWWLGTCLTLGLMLAACEALKPAAVPTTAPTALLPTATSQAKIPGDAARAVDLIGAWVDAGASQDKPFTYKGQDGKSYQATFDKDILPLFTKPNIWFDGSLACVSCHTATSKESAHEMGLGSYAGIMTGADSVSNPPGAKIIEPGKWKESVLRERLRNNRMPAIPGQAGWPFRMDESNRDGPCLKVSDKGVEIEKDTDGKIKYGDCKENAVGLIGAWVDAGAKEKDPFAYGEAKQLTFERDVLPFFTQPNMWFEGSLPCSSCHTATSKESAHEMGLGSYAGIMTGVDSVSNPPGAKIIEPGKWKESVLRGRLRNNRMPPGWTFMMDESNRDGPFVLHGERVGD